MKEEYKRILILFLVAFAIRIVFIFALPIKMWDETIYANLAYELSKNPFDYSFKNKGWCDYIPKGWLEAGFRAPLLPYTLSILYFFHLDFLVEFLMPLIGALSIVLIYLLAKRMFNEKIAFYSSLFLTFLPLHVYYSGRILADVFSTFFVILTAIFFWEGFEKDKTTYKILFGAFLALALLARYTTIWLIPIFPLYLTIKNKGFSFLKDASIWLALFFIILLPLFIFGIKTYGTPLGPFHHAIIAASYWGGTQPWYFFLENSLAMFSILSIIFLLFLFYIFSDKKLIKDYRIIFLLIWFFAIFISASIMPHKEDRFLMQLTPPLVIISAFFISHINKHKRFIFILVASLLFLSCILMFIIHFQTLYSNLYLCFLKSTLFFNSVENNSLVITDESPIVYYYTKRETHFYPNPFSIESLRDLVSTYYKDRPVYILFTEYDMSLNKPKNVEIKRTLDAKFKIVYKCSEEGSLSLVYKYE